MQTGVLGSRLPFSASCVHQTPLRCLHTRQNSEMSSTSSMTPHGTPRSYVPKPLRSSSEGGTETIVNITGAILFWRGIWCSWDALFGFSVWSEVSSVLLGLALMTGARWIRGLMDDNQSGNQPVGGSNHARDALLDKRKSSDLADEDGT